MKRIVIRLTPEAEEVYQYLKIKAPDSKQEKGFRCKNHDIEANF